MTTPTEELSEVRQMVTLLTEAIDNQNKQFQVLSNKIDKTLSDFDKRLMSLGQRWGIQSENSFRNAMAGILIDMGFTVGKI